MANVISFSLILKKSHVNKAEGISAIKLMPDTFDITQLFDRILFLNKIEEGRQQIKGGKTYIIEDANKKLKKWFR